MKSILLLAMFAWPAMAEAGQAIHAISLSPQRDYGIVMGETLASEIRVSVASGIGTQGQGHYTVFAQVVGWNEAEPMIRQARWLHAFSDRIIVKLPASVAGLQVLQQLKTELPDLRLAVTAIASLAQAYLAAKAGADIAAVFNGPLDLAEDAAHDMIAPIRQIYTNYGFQTKILACGRYPRLFGEIAVAGADICTMRMEFMRLLYEHSFTDARMNGFLKSWQGAFGDKTWPGLP